MIHRFRISNFQSVRETVELDFRVPGTTPELECFPVSKSRPDVRLPAIIALYGPNGSGKTTILQSIFGALYFAHASYNNPDFANGPHFLPFLSRETASASTRVEVDLDVRWPMDSGLETEFRMLRYSVTVIRDKNTLMPTQVIHEALYSFPNGRPRRLLERHEGREVYVAKETGVRPKDDRLSTVSKLQKASAISALAAMEAGVFPHLARELAKIRSTFPEPVFSGIDETVANFYQQSPDVVKKLSSELQRIDMGIQQMQVQQLPDGRPCLAFSHYGLQSPVIMQKESSGAKQLVRQFPLFNLALQEGQLVIVDGLDSDLHTELTIEIINWFRKASTNTEKAQLLCSLHNPAILEELEKEEVVIVKKSASGATGAYFASDISGLRRGGNLQKQYRSGIMGGLPRFG